MKKCGKDIKAMLNLFIIQDEVPCQFLKIILEPINTRTIHVYKNRQTLRKKIITSCVLKSVLLVIMGYV
jgi:hypothetical protein